MGQADLQRYKRLLWEKRGELSSAPAEASALVPAAGVSRETFLIKQLPTPKRSSRSVCAERMVASYEQSKTRWPGLGMAPTGAAKVAESQSRKGG